VSIRLMSQVWALDLTQQKKIILLALADHADDEGYCFPSIRRVAWKTGYSRRSVQRIIRSLEESEIVHVSKDAPGTPGKPRVYLLELGNAPKLPPFETGANLAPLGDRRVTPVAQTGAKWSATGDTGGATGDTAMAPESSVESSVETPKNLEAFRLKKSKIKTCPTCSSDLLDQPHGRFYCADCEVMYA
jgi:hypothetical protein